MIGVHSGKFNGKDGGVPTIIEPKPVTPNEPKVLNASVELLEAATN